jgi:hypothetical protein
MLVDEDEFSGKLARYGIARFLVVFWQKKMVKIRQKWVQFDQKQPKIKKNQGILRPFFMCNRESGDKKMIRNQAKNVRFRGSFDRFWVNFAWF